MVWIHGGGFTSGSSKYEVYGPEYLIYHDVVFVSINYRLGCLGAIDSTAFINSNLVYCEVVLKA